MAKGGATGDSSMDRIMALYMRSLEQQEAAQTSAKVLLFVVWCVGVCVCVDVQQL